MEIESACPGCNKRYRGIPGEYAGRTMRCEGCGQSFAIVAMRPEKPPATGRNLLGLQAAGGGGESEADVPVDWNDGEVILGIYQVLKVLGIGGMGKVYKVRHLGWNMELAVKCPKAEILEVPGAKDNFIIEAETWVNLGLHPNICSCYYVRELGRIPRLFAEFVSGGDLEGWIKPRDDGLPILYRGGPEKALERILDIAIQFAWGLQYAHEQGMIHQDIKPANVMLTTDGVAKVTDFGLARMQGGGSGVAAVGMSPRWCSPEQAAQGHLTAATDIWSWGISLLPMFTGAITWRRGTMAPSVLEDFLQAGGKSPAEHIPPMPPALGVLLKECFAEKPEARPASMGELAQRLREIHKEALGFPHARPEPKSGKAMAGSLNNRAVSLVDLLRLDEAEQLWNEALERHPNHTESTFNRGLVQWRSGKAPDDTRFIANLEESRRSSGIDWLNSYLLGLAHLERADYQAARKAFLSAPPEDLEQDEIREALAATKVLKKRTRYMLGYFQGHEGKITALAMDAAGRVVVSASEDKSVRVWDLTTCALRKTLTGHRQSVTGVGVSADGRLAVTACSDNTVKLWDLNLGTTLRTLQGHVKPVSTAAMSADGRLALTGGSDNVLKVWETSSGRCLFTLQGHTGPVNSVALSPDGRLAISGGGSAFARDHSVRLWNVPTGKPLGVFQGHTKPVLAVAFSGDGRLAASGGEDETLLVWEIPSGRLLATLRGHTARINALAMSRDGRHILSAAGSTFADDNTVRVWDRVSGRCVRTLYGHTGPVLAAVMSPDGLFALSAGEGKRLRWWQTNANGYPWAAPMALSRVVESQALFTATAEYEARLEKAREALRGGDIAAAAALVRQAREVSGFERGEAAVALWQELYLRLPRVGFREGWEAEVWNHPGGAVTSLECAQVGELAASGDAQGRVCLWAVGSGQVQREISAHQGMVDAVRFSADGKRLLTAGGDNLLRLWDVASGAAIRTCQGHTMRVRAAVLFHGGRFALSASADETIRLWNLETGKCLRIYKGHQGQVTALALAPDGLSFLSGGEDGLVRVWRIHRSSSRVALKGHNGQVLALDWRGDGKAALSSGADGTLILWDMKTRSQKLVMRGHHGYVHAAALSGDGRFALSAGADHTVRLWDTHDGACLRVFTGHTEGVDAAVFAPGSGFILSGGEDRHPRLWALDWELQEREPALWDEAARPWLEAFFVRRSNPGRPGAVPLYRRLVARLTGMCLAPLGTGEFADAMAMLARAGFGWLRPEGVQQQLEELRLGVFQRLARSVQRAKARRASPPQDVPRPEASKKTLFSARLPLFLARFSGMKKSGDDSPSRRSAA